MPQIAELENEIANNVKIAAKPRRSYALKRHDRAYAPFYTIFIQREGILTESSANKRQQST
jgi:hypothetical protein